MIPDPNIWFQRRPGGPWYKHSDPANAYRIKRCENCGREYLGQSRARYCTGQCVGQVSSAAHRKEVVSYFSAHSRVRRQNGSASSRLCVDCGQRAHEWSYDGSDPGELISPEGYRYSINPERYEPRCKPCHEAHDGHVGTGNPNAYLTAAQVREIYASVGASQQKLADIYGTTKSNIAAIRSGRTHKAITGAEYAATAVGL